MKIWIVGLMFLITIGSAGATTLSTKVISGAAEESASMVAQADACGDIFGAKYTEMAHRIYGQMRKIIELNNYDFEAFSATYDDKIRIIKSIRKIGITEASCETTLFLGERVSKGMDGKIRLSPHGRKKIATVASDGDCKHSADYYGEQIRKNGKMSDVTCFQKAGRRELEASEK